MSIYTIKSVNQFTNNLSDYYVNLLKSWISIKYTKVPSYCNFITIRQEIIYIYIKNKNLTAQRSNSNTAWLNFQTYIIFSINLVWQVTLRSSGTDILHGCHLLRCLYNILYFLWLHDEFFIILYNILKIAELDCCQIIILSIYVPSTHA